MSLSELLVKNCKKPVLAWQVFEHLVLTSPSPPVPSPLSLSLIADLLVSSPALHPHLPRLCSYLLSLPRSLSRHALRRLLRLSLSSSSLEVSTLYHGLRLAGLTPCTYAVNLFISALCDSGRLDHARKLFDEMPRRGIRRNAHTFGLLIRGYCRSGFSSRGLELLDLMQEVELGFSQNIIIFNTLVSGFCREGKPEEAERVVTRMKASGLLPNVVTFNARISGLCKTGTGTATDQARRIFRDMEMQEGLPKPNQVSCNTMLEGLCNAGIMEEASLLVDSMRERGFFGDLQTYNVWLGGLVRNGRLTEARELLDEMEQEGVEPSLFSYNIIVDGLCKQKMMPQAKLVLGLMKRKGVSPDTVTYTSLIHGYCSVGNVGMANKTLSDMLIAGCSPNTFTCNVLLQSLWREGRVAEAENLLQKMKGEEYGLDIVSCNIVIDGLCKNGKLEKAIDIVRGMWQHGSAALGELGNAFLDLVDNADGRPKIVPGLIAYSTLIDGLCKAGRFEEAKKLLLEMMVKNITPDGVIYNTFVGAYCKHGRVSSAFKVAKDMEKKGLRPTTLTYNLLTWGLGKKGQVDEIQGLMKQMKENGVRPDVVTYNNLIYCLCEQGMSKKADAVLKEMMKSGSPPNVTSYKLLIRAYFKAGDIDSAQNMFQAGLTNLGEKEVLYILMCDELCACGRVSEAKGMLQVAIEKGFRIEKFAYRRIVDELCRGDRVDDAHSVVLCMVHKGYQFDPATFMPVIDALVSAGDKREADKLSEQMMSMVARQDKLCEGVSQNDTDWRSVLHRDDGSGVVLKVLKRVQKGWGQGSRTASFRKEHPVS